MKRNDIIFLLSSTVLLTIAWIVFSIIHANTSSTINSILNQEIAPIAPTFDSKIINLIGNREKIIPLYIIPTSISSESGRLFTTPTSIPVQISLSPTIISTQGGKLQ